MNTPPPYDIAFSMHAGRDLREIKKYLTQKASAKVALRVLASLFDAIETLDLLWWEPLAAKKPFFRLSSLNFSSNIPDFDCKICLASRKNGNFSRSKPPTATSLLQEQPERYPPEPLLAAHGNYRVIRKGAYDIFYEFTGYDIYIYRIVHSKRDLSRLFKRFKP